MDYMRTLAVLLILGAATGEAGSQSMSSAEAVLRVDLDLVLVPVTVTDGEGRVVRNLREADFALWEDRIEQQVRYFSAESVPASIGIVLDTSNSMNSTVIAARDAVSAFLDAGHLEDEYFLMEFNDQPQLQEDFTGDVNRLNNLVLRTSPDGKTALYDAVYRAISKAQQGQHPRKVILIVSDGEDNNSRYSRAHLENYIRESGVQIYALGISSHFGKSVLRDLTELTGGRAVFADEDDDLRSVARALAIEMTSQYVLGYVSTNDGRDGQWRELRVRADRGPEAPPALTVRARRGYYARAY
jgi:Ca-activated chloride channel family protein